jgi:hypothetical protein
MKSFNITFIFLSLIIILICILNIFLGIKKGKEGYVNYDPDEVQENCLDYIKTKNWEIDYGMNYKDDEMNQLEKQKHIKDRLEVIAELTTVKTPRYSIWGQKFLYGDACILQKENLKLYNTDKDSCNIQNKVLSNNTINEFGRKMIYNNNIKLYTAKEFSKVTDFDEEKMIPKDGCLIDTRDKNNFFKMIDNLISIKKFERDNQINMYEVEKNQALKSLENEKETNKAGTDKINDLNSYLNKVDLVDSCRNITTKPVIHNDGDLKELDKHDISCSPNEVLQQVKLNATTIPFKKIRYHSTRENGFLISKKDEHSMKLVNFLKVNPSVNFVITKLDMVDSSQEDICTDWGCTCQGFSDKYRTQPGQWQNAPVVDYYPLTPQQAWWIQNSCSTAPLIQESPCKSWECTCQGMSDYFGTWANVGWGYAAWSYIAQQWWGDNKCQTKPDYDGNFCKPWGCTCQGITDKYKTRHGITWGSAPGPARWWWMQKGCHTGNINPLIYDSSQIYSFNKLEEFGDFTWITYSGGQSLLTDQCIADINVIIGDGKKIFYSARCCTINTNIGDNARFAQVSNEESTKIRPSKNGDKWSTVSLYNENDNVITGPASCKDNKLVNSFKLVSNPSDFNYKYTCSDIQNDIVKSKPNKTINWDCSTYYSEPNNMALGKTIDMQDMAIECPYQSYLNDIKLEKNGSAYRMKYKCCKPIMQH